MINEKKLESDIENWFGEVGYNLGRFSLSYFYLLTKGFKEVLSLLYMGRKEQILITIRIFFYGLVVSLLIIRVEPITVWYSDLLSNYAKSFLRHLLYSTNVTKILAVLIGCDLFHGLGLKKQREEQEMHDRFEEIKFFTGKKRTVKNGDEKIIISETPRLIRKIVKDKHTTIYMFQSKGILPEEWDKKKEHLEYILDGHIINIKRGKAKSINLVLVSHEKFSELNEAYEKMEAYDENFEKIGLVGKGSREVEVFGEMKKTKNYPQFIEESEAQVNGKTVLSVTFKSAGLTLQDFRNVKFTYENVMNRLVVDIKQDDYNKQLYIFRTLDTKDELKKLYQWSDDIVDPRDGILVLGEGRLEREVLDLNLTPHSLFGGVTRSGKSVMMKCVVYQTILKGYYIVPIDFKGGLELGVFSEFSDVGVIHKEKRVLEVLKQIEKEHHARIAEFGKFRGVKNIVEYNEAVDEDQQLRRIMIIIDELAEMLDITGLSKEAKALIESIIAVMNTLGRLGAASGIHFLTGTQRPDSKVLSGQIKSNLGARICSRMTDIQPSIMVLGTPDAVKLPADIQGRFMYSIGADPAVLQGYYFKDSDIKMGQYAKGRLLTIENKNAQKEGKSEEKNKKGPEPYEDFDEEYKENESANKSNSGDYSHNEDTSDNQGKSDEKPDTEESSEENEDPITSLVKIIEASDKVTTRLILSSGLNLETGLDILKIIYTKKLVDQDKLNQIKVILFKENRLSKEEYSGRTNAEPII